MNKKTLREERTAAEWKDVAQQPAAGEILSYVMIKETE